MAIHMKMILLSLVMLLLGSEPAFSGKILKKLDKELKKMGLQKLQNFLAKIGNNALDIQTYADEIHSNIAHIDNNTIDIASASANIGSNNAELANLTNAVGTNTAAISTNTAGVSNNAAALSLRHHVSEECTCQTITISFNLTGSLTIFEFLNGDYQESAMVNGHPSWINNGYGIWFADDLAEWVIGSIWARGSTTHHWIESNGQGGSKCPFEISSTNWRIWFLSQWHIGSGSGLTCLQAKILNADVHGVNSSLPLVSADDKNNDLTFAMKNT